MIALAVVLSYLLVTALTARATLRIILSRQVCTEHREGWFTGKCFSSYHTAGRESLFDDGKRITIPLGELTERPMSIVAASLGFGLIWPLTLLFVFVLHAPPTSDELVRTNAELAERIRKLESDLGRLR